MLVATRDPLTEEASSFRREDRRLRPRGARLVGMLQIAGTLLGIPVGLGSVYSIYRANFSIETVCQNLRSNIVSMIDKKIDPTTRRILVRRDVETFEKFCGIVDPDAEVAFKRLLAAEKEPVAVPRPVESAPAGPRVTVAMPKSKPYPTAAKQPSITNTPEDGAQAKNVQPLLDKTASDAQWLQEVRIALVHKPAKEPETPKERELSDGGFTPAPSTPPAPHTSETQPLITGTAVLSPAPVALLPAPALPPPDTVAKVPSQTAGEDHPVPPAAIPETAEARSTWISQIPFVGQILDR